MCSLLRVSLLSSPRSFIWVSPAAPAQDWFGQQKLAETLALVAFPPVAQNLIISVLGTLHTPPYSCSKQSSFRIPWCARQQNSLWFEGKAYCFLNLRLSLKSEIFFFYIKLLRASSMTASVLGPLWMCPLYNWELLVEGQGIPCRHIA
jgi:hypothetical protein